MSSVNNKQLRSLFHQKKIRFLLETYVSACRKKSLLPGIDSFMSSSGFAFEIGF